MNVPIFLLSIALMLASCGGRVKFTYDNAVRNELEFFFEPNNDSMNFYHDIENAEISGYFIPNNMINYFMNADSVALKDNWENIVNDRNKKIYIKALDNGDYSICTLHGIGNQIHLRILSL